MSTDMLEDSLYEQEVESAKARSDTMFCPECHSPNPATRKFCVNCGTALWEPCFRCNTLCPADGNFCGACGADLRSTAASQVRKFEAQLNTAEDLRANMQFDEALEILNQLAANDHPRLIERVRHVEQRIETIAAEQARREAEARQTMADAQELFDLFRYQEAALKLEAVPRPLRTDTMEMLLDRAAANDAEVQQLLAELHRDLQTHLDDRVFRKLVRLLDLQPNHPKGLELNKTLQGRLFKQARQYLAAFRYSEAAALLEQIPEETRLPAVKSLCTLAVELAWLWSDLRRVSHVDRTLLEAAERLCKLSPKHAKAAQLRDELRQRLKAKEQATELSPAMPWAAVKSKSGAAPLVWYPDFRRLALSESCDPAPLMENRGVFFTAAGLALQGLGQAHIDINLRTAVGNAVLNKMRGLLATRPHSAWGIDVGSHAMKAVKLVVDRKDKQHVPRIERALHVRYGKDLCRSVNDEQRNELIVEALHELLAEDDALAQSQICVGLSGRSVLSRLLDIPGVEKSKFDDMVLYEAQHHVPLRLDDLTWGYQRLNPDPPSEADGPSEAKSMVAKALAKAGKGTAPKRRSRHKVFLLLIKGEDVIRALAPFRELGIRVDVAQSEPVALYNALHYELSTPPQMEEDSKSADKSKQKPEKREKPLHLAPSPSFAAVDVGSESSALVFGGADFVWIRHLHTAGETYTRQLVQELQLTFEKAERLKHEPHTARSLSALFRVLEPVTVQLAEEADRLGQTFASDHSGSVPARRLLVGGGAQLHGFAAGVMNALTPL